jgi:hypothetical protein
VPLRAKRDEAALTTLSSRSAPTSTLLTGVHARVEDVIRAGKGTGLGRFPFRDYRVNKARGWTRP